MTGKWYRPVQQILATLVIIFAVLYLLPIIGLAIIHPGLALIGAVGSAGLFVMAEMAEKEYKESLIMDSKPEVSVVAILDADNVLTVSARIKVDGDTQFYTVKPDTNINNDSPIYKALQHLQKKVQEELNV